MASAFAGFVGLLAVSPSALAWTPHPPIVINGNAEFTPANGVTMGTGTPADPYIIEGWEIDGSANSGIEVYNTDAHFVIRDVHVHSALIDAIFLYSVRNGRVENATAVSGNDAGLYIQVSSNITVASSNISFSNLDAIVLDWSSNITVEENQMWGNGDWGVFMYESDDIVIRNNTIANNGWIGIELSLSSDRVTVEGNSVTNNNVAGLALDTASNVTVLGNTFADNDYNVDLTNSNDVLIRNNTIATSTADGLTITGGSRMTIEENNITGNGGGVLAVGATGLLVRHNAFWGNLPQAADNSGANAWDDGYPSGGNFWSDYAGVDDCSGPNQDVCPLPDGIGDTPYVIDADSQDRYPLMQPFVSGRTMYAVTVIPPLPGDLTTIPWGINATGAVVGWSTDGGRERPFLFTDAGGTVPLLVDANRGRGTARDINADGLAVGGIYSPDPEQASRWTSPVTSPDLLGVLGAGPTSHAWGVNETGAIVGWSDYGGFSPHAFLYTDGGGMVDLTPSQGSGHAYDVNDAGLVVGYMTAGGNLHAFRWSALAGLEDLGVPGSFAHSFGFAINGAGQVAGCVDSATGNTERIARYTDGVGWDILGGGGETNCAWGINAFGDVVGNGRPTGTGIVRAFLYEDGEGMLDLERFIDPALQMRLLDATDINDAGQIVGYAWDNTIAQYRGVRLTPTAPVPRPPTVTLIAPNGGEDWTGGTAHDIVWDMDDLEDVSLSYIMDLDANGDGAFEVPITSGVMPTGSGLRFAWMVPALNTEAARIRVCAFDSGGFSACDLSGWFIIDSTGPTLILILPPSGATNVDPNASIILTFDEGMSQLETELALSISPAITFTTTWDAPQPNSREVTVDPTNPLLSQTTYTLTVDCGAQDDSDSGNALQGCPATFSFTTAPIIEDFPPVVDLTSPDGGEVWSGGSMHDVRWTMIDDNPGDLAVDLYYSTDGGLTWSMIAAGLLRPQGANVYAWTLPCPDSGNVRVRVNVSDGARSGTDTSTLDFSIDCTAPGVLDTVPANGDGNVGVTPPIRVVFSETMDRAAAEGAFSISPNPGALGFTWSGTTVSDDTLDVSHNAFAMCTQYIVAIAASAEDASDPGIAMGSPFIGSFSTVCAPIAAILEPVGGESWSGGVARTVRVRVSDETDTELRAWLNATIGGAPTSLFAGLLPAGETAIPWTVSATTAVASLRLEVADSSGLTAAASSPAFAIDGTPPALVATDPEDGFQGASVDASLVLTFSEPMNPAATEAAITTTPSTPPMSFSWDPSNSVLTIQFTAPLAANTNYAVAVACGARDASDPGNPLAGCPTSGAGLGFRTEPEPPIASAVAVTDARVGVPVTLDGRGSTGAVVRWTWTIQSSVGAELATLEGPVVTYTFGEAGRFAVILWVTDSIGRTDEYAFDVTVVNGEREAGNGWLFVVGGAAALATILFAASEPGRVAIMTATVARVYGRRPKDEKDSEIRGAVLYYVRVHPGDTYMDVKRNLDLNDGVVTYHLMRLEKDGLIRSAIRGARKRYYPEGMRVPVENGGELHEIQQRILRVVAASPGMPVTVLAEQLGVSEQLALYHLRKLSLGKQVSLERSGWRLRAFPGGPAK